MNHFFDSSAFAKIFLPETGSTRIEAIVRDVDNLVFISELALVEFRSALFRRVRMDEVTQADSDAALTSLKASLFRFKRIDFTSLQLTEAASLLEKFSVQYNLRTLDSLQLASFFSQAHPDWAFVTSDEKLACLVRFVGYKVINPTKLDPRSSTI